jgi:hypothetical protein
MLQIKTGSKVKGIQPELVLGLNLLSLIFISRNVDFVITELTGSKHMEGSLHYKGLAADIRSKHIEEGLKVSILNLGQQCLSSNYDFILEGKGTPNEHFHIEFDPKE